ncbi:cyclin-T1-2-like isoform X2 [Panicum virgatum]|nr:cyclin-T1-2-like isoform X2 [Panicum virgatum]XP_039817955.1 cyclin-T1-2-like isoform X2 [Panicum virgatum]KAG2568913.1 hypothetical protein PVAP13_7NG362300 [Panicum virgatum]KAG2568914.1 hypothetical protein PVAP13_7NG362300 [Panicum virgatum]KAG2568915.1 hypothetical protein PVAP13_7NG362300 [Panicum virgatum]KAG2568918.1 hypothetical protein PVAP13_7NG362300 [Panicum virgatum]
MYRRDTAAAQRIRQKDIFEKQKALILIGERLVLTTIRFDFNIQHPYRPLFDAMRNLGINQKEVKQVAWNFVNDWLKTTLCLQYKPQYIAAGSLYLAAKLHNIKLPLHGAHVWWHQFDVAPKPLEAVIQQMMEHAAVKKLMPARPSPVKQKEVPCEAKLHISNSPDSVLNQSSLLISSSSPDIGEPSDPMQLDSCQYLTSSHTSDGRVSGPDSSSLSVSAYINVSRKVHDEESLHQASITKHDAGMMSCSNQTSLDAIAATEGSAECMQLDASHCTVNGKILNQASRNWHGGNVNPLSVVISLDAKVDKESTWCVEPLIGSSNHCSDSLIADSLCTDQILADVASVPINNASSALPVLVEAVPSRAELKNVDVVRIKDLLSKRKRQREVQERAIGSDDLGEEAWIERELESGIVMKQEAAASDELSDEAWIERELEAGIVVGPRNKQAITLDGLSEDDWIERELESGIILGPASASKKQKLDSSCC